MELKGTGPAAGPDKFYGCDNKTTPCAGVTMDLGTNVVTLAPSVWPEVDSPAFDGSKPDTVVAGGARVTVSGVLRCEANPAQRLGLLRF